jgi:hypothetical protein
MPSIDQDGEKRLPAAGKQFRLSGAGIAGFGRKVVPQSPRKLISFPSSRHKVRLTSKVLGPDPTSLHQPVWVGAISFDSMDGPASPILVVGQTHC